ncbi:MAG: glycosyltransferase family 2 protein, partial [Eubacteriales bacterium]
MRGLISVIVPIYNAEKYILQTIEMVMNQTYANWELILVDDLSTDKSVEVVEELLATITDERIKLIKQNKNTGAAHSRNKGVRAAAGRYIAFLDADDIWLPEKLEVEIAFMKERN